MRKITNLVFRLSLCILCFFALFSCASTPDVPPMPNQPTADEPSEQKPPLDPNSRFSIDGVDISAFTIIRAEDADRESREATSALREWLQEEYQVKLTTSTDEYTPEDATAPYEIVLGVSDRTGTPTLSNPDDAIVAVTGGRLYFCASQGKTLSALIEHFFDTYAKDANGEIKPLHLEDGFMKQYQGKIVLQREDGEKVKTHSDYNCFDYGVTGHPNSYEAYPESQLETQIRLAAELGISIYRFNYNPVTEEHYAYLTRVLDLCDAYGLDMMLVLDDFHGTPEEIAEKHKQLAIRCRGRIPYYQIFNETDVYAMYKDDGTTYRQPVGTGEGISEFNPARVDEIREKLKASIAVFREYDPDAKLVINFAFKHFAMIKAFYDEGLRWDIIGIDWYSDMEGSEPLASFLPRVQAQLPDFEYMICECNIWAHTPYTEEEQAAYLEKFVTSLANSAKIENLTAVIFYELLDEPAFNNGESHFGLVKNDRNGKPQEKKLAYTTIQTWLCGGEVSAKFTMLDK